MTSLWKRSRNQNFSWGGKLRTTNLKIAEAVETALETSNTTLLEKVATKKDIAYTKKDIAEAKAEVIKWMFIFWIGQFASIVGVLTAIIFAFFKK